MVFGSTLTLLTFVLFFFHCFFSGLGKFFLRKMLGAGMDLKGPDFSNSRDLIFSDLGMQ